MPAMKMIIAIIRPGKLSSVKMAMDSAGFTGITAIAVKGRGSQKGVVEQYRGSEYKIDLLDKVEIKVVVNDDELDKAINIIIDSAKTGEVGDGKIFVLNVEEAIRIRTNQTGEEALDPK